MDSKKCEICSEEIHLNASRCPFCSAIQVNKDLKTASEEKILESSLGFSNEDKSDREHKVTINLEKSSTSFPDAYDDNSEKFNMHQTNTISEMLQPINILSNYVKVLFSAISTFPIFGQLLSLIAAIIFISEPDEDRKSFGKALMIASFVFLIFWTIIIGGMFFAVIVEGNITNLK